MNTNHTNNPIVRMNAVDEENQLDENNLEKDNDEWQKCINGIGKFLLIIVCLDLLFALFYILYYWEKFSSELN